MPVSNFLHIVNMLVFIFLHRFILFYTIYISILKYYGASPIFISVAMVVHELGKITADIYTGAIADKFGIRKVMAFGLCLKALGISFWLFDFDGFYWYLFGMFLLGIGRSCTVGKIEVYTYNVLYSVGINRLFRDVWTAMFILDGISASCVAYLAGFLYEAGGFNFGLFFSVFIILVIHVPFVLIFMADPDYIDKKLTNNVKIYQIITDGLLLIKSRKDIMLLMLLAGMVPSLFIVFSKFKILIANDIGLSVKQIANLDSISHLLQILVSLLILLFMRLLGISCSIKFNILAILLSFLIVFVNGVLFYKNVVIYSIMIFTTLYPTIITSLKSELESSLPNNIRATISSFASLLFSLFNVVFLLLVGLCAHFASYQFSVCIITGIVLVVLLIIYTNRIGVIPFFTSK